MKKSISLAVILLVVAAIIPVAHPAFAADEKITIGFDLAHGENSKYISNITAELDYANVIVINQTFDQVDLSQFDIIVLGQPTTYLAPEELDALSQWLNTGGKVLWLAGDSDYGGGPDSQQAVNAVAEYIGSHLRVDMGAIYDNTHNAQKFYRVLAQVAPDQEAAAVANGITHPILAHGPDNVVYLYDNGSLDLLACQSKPEYVIRIARFYPTAYLADNNPPPALAVDMLGVIAGESATAEAVTGCPNATYVFIAAEMLPASNGKASMVIVSGESPYGDYEPTFAPEYYNVTLDGPKFLYNIFKWAYNYTETFEFPVTFVTVTKTVTETQTVTESVTTTKTQTLTKTATTTETTTKTTTQTVTATKTSTSTTTVTKTKTNTGAIIGASVIILIALIAAAYILKK